MMGGRKKGAPGLGFFFLNDPATTEFYPLPLHAPLPISSDRLRKGRRPGRGLWGTAALSFDGGPSGMGFHDEVDSLSSVPPIVKLTLTCCGGIGKMRADRGFNQPSAEFPI